MLEFLDSFLKSVLLAVVATVSIIISYCIYDTCKDKKEDAKKQAEAAQAKAKKEHAEIEEEKREQKARERPERIRQKILDDLQERVWDEFGVELDEINENTAQDEIVRIVNSMACAVAVSCVKQDKIQRGDKYELEPSRFDYPHVLSPYANNSDITWPQVIKWQKEEWSRARKLALQIIPELAERLPHFSNFEPLKSYNAKHLLQKKAKQKSTA